MWALNWYREELGNGGGTIINRYAPFYLVSYIPTEPEDIVYVKPLRHIVSYKNKEEVVSLSYKPLNNKVVIRYIEKEPIKIEVLCQI